MKKVLAIFLILIFCGVAMGEEIQYIASKIWRKDARYHYPTCIMIKRIHNKIYFNTPKEAIDEGYSRCKICKPPEGK